MKKIYLLLWVISVICLLPACSDEGAQDPGFLNPVKNAIVPEKGIIGGEITVVGAGFTAEGRIYLKNTKSEIEAVVTNRTPEDITFRIPEDLLVGVYDVILRQQGDWKLGSLKLFIPEQPVKEVVIPKRVIPGSDVTITGQGFNIISEIYLQQGEQEVVVMQVMNMDDNSITFFVPETFPEGDYNVILHQDGDWMLGSIKVKTPQLVKVVREGDQVLTRTFEYDSQKRMTAMQVKAEDGELELNYTLTYSGTDQLKVTISGTDVTGTTVNETQVYTLENGHAVSEGTCTFDYDENGFLISMNEVDKISYQYEENKLTYIIFNEDILSDHKELSYGLSAPKNNQTGVDLMAFIFDSENDGSFNYAVEMRLWGISGKYPEYLTTYVMEWGTWDSVSYDYEKTGTLLSKILVNEGETVYAFTYE